MVNIHLAIAALVDELADGLEVGVSVGNVRLNNLQHLNGGLGEADEDTIVDLEKTEKLEGLALLGVDLVDTLDTDNEGELGLSGNVERAVGLGGTAETDGLTLSVAVLLDVALGTLEDGLTLLLVGLDHVSGSLDIEWGHIVEKDTSDPKDDVILQASLTVGLASVG